MSLYNSETYLNDIRLTLEKNDFIKELSNKSILITGASGLICSNIVDLLLFSNKFLNLNINVYVAGRNEEKMKERFSIFNDSKFLHFIKYDADKQNAFNFKVDYIIHGASNAYPAIIQKYPIKTMLANFLGIYELLEYSKQNMVVNTLFISSSEVYGKKESIAPFLENEYGFIDILDSRSSYSISKRAAETLCASYTKECNIKTTIVRPGHIYGPTAKREDNRISSQFTFQAIDGKDIVLKSDGKQLRSYCYVFDCSSAILKVLLNGDKGNAYNISNKDSLITIKKMAELISKNTNVDLKFENPSNEDKAAFNPMNNSALNADKLYKLGWNALFDSNIGVEHMINSIKEAEGKK